MNRLPSDTPTESSVRESIGKSIVTNGLDIWLAVCSICLIATTRGLWFPAWFGVEFPASSISDFFAATPLSVDCWLSVFLLVGWGLLAVGGCISQFGRAQANWPLSVAGSIAVLTSGIILVLLNQHRLQPWHFQGLLFLLILRLGPRQQKLQLLQWLTISIYFYSAISKFDYQFAHTVGQDLLRAAFQIVPGLGDPPWTLVWVIPVVELVVALLLAYSRTRTAGALIACGLHIGLILILGPAGLQHSLGVLLWNAHFIGIVLLLFVAPGQEPAHAGEPSTDLRLNVFRSVTAQFARLVVFAAMALPIGERFGLWDHWPSWALYAPHSSRVELHVSTTSVTRLPESLKRRIGDFREEDLWVRVPLASWSLQQTGAPIYPQARFQWAVALDVANRIDSPFEVQAEYWPCASRWTGERKKVMQSGTREIRQFASHFRLGCLPRTAQDSQAVSDAP